MKHILRLETCESTNTYAKSLMQTHHENFAVIATEQTKGKGTHGKSFYSPKGKGLYISMVFYDAIPFEKVHTLTLKMAHHIQTVIKKHTGIQCQVVLPNDLYIDGKKVCGILTETTLDNTSKHYEAIVVGVGLNVYKVDNLPEDIKDIHTSLQNHTQETINMNDLTNDILTFIP